MLVLLSLSCLPSFMFVVLVCDVAVVFVIIAMIDVVDFGSAAVDCVV